ncbi:MAG: hydroxymethylglutaryl-CoA synthase [Candidatus Korarchaeota archaeon]|nr:hydroxymethylglutaryl-CoA synthase [Candidatus Korarchaeota archaeon]NIU82839.1 hydroxymethylglutaryl-CoA synthase [Candidatus Thorarchaeota archaeon]NIW13322.1 hydroxymethylglutaryl-CoA synthase [Candidatus Thorarchaeota archaeon]NIW51428.1 hydroxymethylglutaryl-CoA synthase [Candidatus Korarchaeota archaeon]
MQKAMIPKRSVSILGYGSYIPKYRIKAKEIDRIWNKGVIVEDAKSYPPVQEKAVGNQDEDAITIGCEATRRAMKSAGIDPSKIRAIFLGSESNPYAVKTAGVTIAEAIGASSDLLGATYEFACKAATEGMQTLMGLIGSNMIDYGIAIGADTAQARPADVLEYTAASGGTALVLGPNSEDAVAQIEASYSYSEDTPDFWRREGRPYPRHYERFTGEPAYFKFVLSAAKTLMSEVGYEPDDLAYVVLHQPNYKFPYKAAKKLGFNDEQITPGLLCNEIGNLYAGSTLTGIAGALDEAEPHDKILAVSYGSGSGSDAFILNVEEDITKKRDRTPKVRDLIDNRKEYIDYSLYSKMREKIKR